MTELRTCRLRPFLPALLGLMVFVSGCSGGSGESCDGDLVSCDGECVDLLADARFCSADGTCGPGCGVGEICDGAGACAPGCPDGTLCEHGCQDPMAGTCYPQCNPDATCCEADGTFTAFGPVSDCPAGESCSAGRCLAQCDAAAEAMTSVGCGFDLPTSDFYTGIAPPCLAVMLTNTWMEPAELTVSRDGVGYAVTLFGRVPTADPDPTTWPAVPATGVPPGGSAVLFLSHDPASVNSTPLTCPVAPAISATGGSAVDGSGIGAGWKITSTAPISLYDIIPYGGAASYLPSAQLVLPTATLGTRYIAVLPEGNQMAWGQVLATVDGTTIEITSTVDLPLAGSVPAITAGTPTMFTLDAGEYVQWRPSADMSGSSITSDQPIAFVGGRGYICYSSSTSSGGGCESAHQMIPPTQALGSEYVAAPYADRGTSPEALPYRIVGTADGTTLSFAPAVPGAPSALNAGEVADFEAVGSFIVRSQDDEHPIYVGQMMTGVFTPGNTSNAGDEEFVNVIPTSRFLDSYAFFTDTSYHTTELALVRVSGESGFADVDVDCYGTVDGWVPVGTSGEYETTHIYLINGGMPTDMCTNGGHNASSAEPFGLTVWGLDSYSSYAYPAGGDFTPR